MRMVITWTQIERENESISNGCLIVPILFVIFYILFGKIVRINIHRGKRRLWNVLFSVSESDSFAIFINNYRGDFLFKKKVFEEITSTKKLVLD